MSPKSDVDCVILGAGVIGLTVALELCERGFRPTIVARDLPGDSESTSFASPWAGANWHSFETESTPSLRWDLQTYKRFEQLERDIPHLVSKREFVDIYNTPVPVESIAWRSAASDYRLVKASASEPLPANAPYAHKFTSFALNAPEYIKHLAETAKSKGVRFIRRRLTSLDQAYALPEIGNVSLVINASGLGARSLGGVKDENVYGARGQTLLVHAPEVTRCIMRSDAFEAAKKVAGGKSQGKYRSLAIDTSPPPPPYIIPRPGTGGNVIIGGTYEKDAHSTLPDLEKAKRTLQDCFELDNRLAKNGGTWRDIDVVSVNVGVRPCREGGPRVELQRRKIGDGWQPGLPVVKESSRGREVAVIHAYGFGGVGYISSVGAAMEVADLAAQYRQSGSVRAKL